MLRPAAAVGLATLLIAAAACAEEAPPGASGAGLWVAIAGETFVLEVADDGASRLRGLSGRPALARNRGMLFVYPDVAPRAMVMRDCPAPIDVAFLDAEARVVSVAAMRVEPPRQPQEGRWAYEARLPVYRSASPAQFAIEVAGGRLAELGVVPGTHIPLDVAALVARASR